MPDAQQDPQHFPDGKATESGETKSVGDRVASGAFIICLMVLSYIAGSFMMYERIFPATVLRQAFQGGIAFYGRLIDYRDPYYTDFWQPVRTAERGVVRYNDARAGYGMTLYTSGHAHRAFLMDMNGQVRHEWSLRYSEAWDKSSAVKRPLRDEFIYIEKAHVLPNGDLLALYAAIGDTPWGYGLVKMDKDSKVIWKFLQHTHHDFELDDQGNIFVLTQEISDTKIPGFPRLARPRIDDFIVKLSSEGKVLDKLPLMEAFAASRMGRRLHFASMEAQERSGDYLHANSVRVLRDAIPGVPESRPGQLLVSLREVNAIVLVDMESKRIVWTLSGSWQRQHDAQLLRNGRILMFDNEGNPIGNGPSRIIEIDPATQAVVWSYTGTEERPLHNIARGSQSRLENGNTLIVESYAGRLIEVAPDGEVVWEFVNPVRGGPKQASIPIIFWVQRLNPDSYFTPEFREKLDPT